MYPLINIILHGGLGETDMPFCWIFKITFKRKITYSSVQLDFA